VCWQSIINLARQAAKLASHLLEKYIMRMRKHGGGCCGITHLEGFLAYPIEETLKQLNRKMELFNGPRRYWRRNTGQKDFNVALECVLTDQQLSGKRRYSYQAEGTGTTWKEELDKRGFKLVFRFKNQNSGNYCNVFYYTPSGE
jgi:hypothetical protein